MTIFIIILRDLLSDLSFERTKLKFENVVLGTSLIKRMSFKVKVYVKTAYTGRDRPTENI